MNDKTVEELRLTLMNLQRVHHSMDVDKVIALLINILIVVVNEMN